MHGTTWGTVQGLVGTKAPKIQGLLTVRISRGGHSRVRCWVVHHRLRHGARWKARATRHILGQRWHPNSLVQAGNSVFEARGFSL